MPGRDTIRAAVLTGGEEYIGHVVKCKSRQIVELVVSFTISRVWQFDSRRGS